MPIQFILASASPARRRLLQGVGINPLIRPSDFDESQVKTSDPAELVQTLALHKAETIAAQVPATSDQPPTLVLGCDSVLALNGVIHGKPSGPEDAIARWQQMCGQVGELYTGHALIAIDPQYRALVRCQVTRVFFANISDRQIAAYVETGEPLGCAGCFALEGRGGLFIEKIEGCHSNVIGLSLPLLRQMLEAMGYDITDFWPG